MTRRYSIIALACLNCLAATSRAADAPPAAGGDSNIGEIVVTATRRSEAIDKVPISVSAFSQEAMEQRGIKSIDDVARFTPGLNFAASTDGLTSSIAIRGVASGVGSSTTGIYVDDTPIQVRSGTGVVTENAYPQIFDLERVEVLRGPQGTLFGTGSMGGTIRFITPEPNLHQYAGHARAEYATTKSGDPSYEAGVAAGGPIVDGTLGFRVSAFYSEAGGFVDREPFTGTTVTDKAINFDRTTVLRGALKLAAGDALTITPSFLYQKKTRNDNYFWTGLSDPQASQFATGFTQPQPISDQLSLPAVKIDWRVGQVDLISNTSYLYRRLDRTSDYSNFLWFALVGDPTPRAPLPDYRTVSKDQVRQNSFTQEVRVQSDAADGNLQWVVGAVYQTSRLYTNQYEVDPKLPALSQAVYGDTIVNIFGEGLVDGIYSATIDQWARDQQTALFGQVDYSFAAKWKSTLGLRVARTTLDFYRLFGGPLLCAACTGSPEVVKGSTPSATPVTPKVGLSYEPDSKSLYYFSAGKGNRVGGVNNTSTPTNRPGCPSGLQAPASYASDNLWSYELGTKLQFAGGRVRLQGSVFYIDWKDIQQSVSANGCFTSSYKDNLGNATVKGFDLSAELRPIDHLLLALVGGYTDAQYASTAYGAPAKGTGIRGVLASTGDSLGVAPWNLGLSVEYEFPLLEKQGYFRADYTYTARDTGRPTYENPVNVTYDPDLQTDPALRLLGVRLGMKIGEWDVSLFGRNLLNSAPILGRNHDGVGDPLYYAVTLRPRTVGVTGTYRF